MRVIKLLKEHKLIEPFLHPVDPKKLGIPHYFDIIKEPMDLKTVEENLKKDIYIDEQEIKEDLNKIWDNAMTFNSSDTDIYDMANHLKEYCEDLFLKKSEKHETKVNLENLKERVVQLNSKDLKELMQLVDPSAKNEKTIIDLEELN